MAPGDGCRSPARVKTEEINCSYGFGEKGVSLWRYLSVMKDLCKKVVNFFRIPRCDFGIFMVYFIADITLHFGNCSYVLGKRCIITIFVCNYRFLTNGCLTLNSYFKV